MSLPPQVPPSAFKSPTSSINIQHSEDITAIVMVTVMVMVMATLMVMDMIMAMFYRALRTKIREKNKIFTNNKNDQKICWHTTQSNAFYVV